MRSCIIPLRLSKNMALSNAARRATLVAGFLTKRCFQKKPLFSDQCRVPAASTSVASFHSSSSWLGEAIYADHELAAALQEENKTLPYPLRHVEFTTRRTLAGQSACTEGLKFRAAYIDTNPEADASVPTVVTLHGAPGSHLDFKHMIEYLPKQKLRVVSVNFPGFNWTPMDSEYKFGHTTPEKTVFLAEFLETLNISKVDVMAVHSAGTYPAVRLCESTDIVRSLLLINPVGHRWMKSFSPWWFFKNHARFSRTPILQTFLLLLLKLRLKLVDSPNKDALLMSAAVETLARFDYEKQQEAIFMLASKKFPVFIMYSENDHAVEEEISYELAMKLGGSPDLMQHYDSGANIVQPITSQNDHNFRGYVFKKGGHFLTRRHPEIVNQAILDLHNLVAEK